MFVPKYIQIYEGSKMREREELFSRYWRRIDQRFGQMIGYDLTYNIRAYSSNSSGSYSPPPTSGPVGIAVTIASAHNDNRVRRMMISQACLTY
jgi:hypothetical protein